jgi:hypothetical protein
MIKRVGDDGESYYYDDDGHLFSVPKLDGGNSGCGCVGLLFLLFVAYFVIAPNWDAFTSSGPYSVFGLLSEAFRAILGLIIYVLQEAF